MTSSMPPVAERWRREEEFHERMVDRDTRWTAFRSYGLSADSIKYAKNLVGDLTGKVIVDVGCGDGRHTQDFVSPGATVFGIDISRSMARVAQTRLVPLGRKVGCTVCCQQMPAEQLALSSESVDVLFGISVLHHLDIPLALAEFKRVLKPGGRAVFVEPLRHNPAAKLYRFLFPSRHSQDETPVDWSLFELLGRHFGAVKHREFYLLSVLAAAFAFLRTQRLFDCCLSALNSVDEWLFDGAPFLRRYAWITVINVTK